MRIVVLAKQVPEHPDRLDPVTHRLVRDGRPALDDADAVGIELALRLAPGPQDVVLVSMGPVADGLRTGLALGAARAVLVSDPGLAGADALTTAKALAAAIERLQPVDLVVAATESTDGYTGVLPSQLAELLGLPAVTFARRVDIGDGELRAERQTEAGHDDVVCPLPCLVTVTSGAAVPHYPSFKAIVGAKSKPVEVVDAPVAADPGQEVVDVQPVDDRRHGEIVDDDGQGHERILDLLTRLKVL
ncbi:MAG: electron transfer flavoprotein subunit beta/FixA family protein [Acidimicrobiales bacterium]